MEFQLESLDQQVLEHLVELLLGGFGWIFGLAFDVEAIVAGDDPV
jgi:hypothetical protein